MGWIRHLALAPLGRKRISDQLYQYDRRLMQNMGGTVCLALGVSPNGSQEVSLFFNTASLLARDSYDGL